MISSTFFRILAFACLCFPIPAFAVETPVILPPDEPDADPSHRIVWPTDPGIRYELQQSTDLESWTTVEGFPSEAQALAEQHEFEANVPSLFFRVIELDEQSPEIVKRSPGDGAFAERRFSAIRVTLNDASPIDPDSISLDVADHGPFTVASPELSFEEDVLVLDLGGDVALGGYGETVDTSLTVADALGNAATYDWSFDLEVEAQVVEDVFVFGSPDAVRAGQQIGAIPTRILTARAAGGPVRMSATADPWTLEDVEPDRLLIRYVEDAPPQISAGAYLANLTPATLDERFYRKVLSIDDDPGEKLLTIMTEDVALEEIVQEGSTVLDLSDLHFPIGEDGVIEEPVTGSFGRLGYSLDGWSGKLKNGEDFDILEVHAEELHWWLTPAFKTSLDIGLTGLSRFKGSITGEVEAAMILDVDVLLAGVSSEVILFRVPAASRPGFWVPLGSIGPIPVSGQIQFNVELSGEAEAGASMNFRSGFRQEASAEFGIDYDRERESRVEWIPEDRKFLRSFSTEVEPFTTQIDGELSLKLKLKPSLSFLVYGLAGIEASLPAAGGLVFSQSSNDVLTGRLETDVSLQFATAGQALEFLDPKPTLSRTIWERPWHLFPESESLTLVREPQSVTIQEGDDLVLFAQATSALPVRYQWFQNGRPLWGKDLSSLWVGEVNSGAAGEYYVRVISGGENVQSETATVTVNPPADDPGPAPEGFALIPAGSFEMGDHFGEGHSSELPVHTVEVSAFYMGRTEVTKARWDAVRSWAANNGYSDLPAGGGKGSDHPVHSVSWFDAVKWLNAWSEWEGLAPVYRVNGAIYKTGESAPEIDYSANGYRLPTEAEWEKAARGGLGGRRFPWGDTISHDEANYQANGSQYTYDVSPYSDWTTHPDYNDGTDPYTSPVGSFAANGYGLYDMSGNVWEWCNDWYDSNYYSNSPGVDPRGPSSGAGRVRRGGGWYLSAFYARVSDRRFNYPHYRLNRSGFRPARSSVP